MTRALMRRSLSFPTLERSAISPRSLLPRVVERLFPATGGPEHQLDELPGGPVTAWPAGHEMHRLADLVHRVSGAAGQPGPAQGREIIHVVAHIGGLGGEDIELGAELLEGR